MNAGSDDRRLGARLFVASALTCAATAIGTSLAVATDGLGWPIGGGILLLGLTILLFFTTRFAKTSHAARRDLERIRQSASSADGRAKRLDALFEGLDEGIAFLDRAGAVLEYNPAFERLAGRPLRDDTRVTSLFRDPRIHDAFDSARGGETVVREIDLGDRVIEVTAVPHDSGALLMLSDLTSMRKLEHVRRDFVANVSHELKTPLTSVMGFGEALAQGDLPPDQASDFAGRIVANAGRMRHLVEDLLDLAMVESGDWDPTSEIISIADTTRSTWAALASDLGAPVSQMSLTGPDLTVAVDREALGQVLRNLLDNAARYAGEGPIAVQIEEDGAMVRTTVTDSGPGIPSEHVERVFERFYRADPARSRERGGTGLGLSIVKHFVETQGGEVGIDSQVGQGTSVWFTLPKTATPSET